MVALAKASAKNEMGSSAHLLTQEVRQALVSRHLVGIIATQDEEVAKNIGEVFYLACQILTTAQSPH